MKKILFYLAAAALLNSFLFAAVGCKQQPKDEKLNETTVPEAIYSEGLDKGIEKIMNELDVIGLGVAVVRGGELVYKNNWGYKNLESKTPLAEDDLYRIASISKSFTAASLMQLAERGELDLNADVSDLVGFTVRNPKYPDVKITPYMLLTHTSSLNDSGGYFKLDVINPEVNNDYAKSYNSYRPGTQYEYCNLGFNTLGTILERVSKIRFDEYVKSNVLKPLGLGYAGYWIESLDSTKFVTLYQADKDGVMQPEPDAYAPRKEEIANYKFGYSTPIFSPTGGMKINPVGLARVMQMHMGLGTTPDGVKIIAPQSAMLMQSRLVETDDYPADDYKHKVYYGFALETATTLIPGKTMIGHTGSAYGAFTSMFWNSQRTFGIIVMTNGCKGDREQGFMAIHRRVVNCLYQNLIKGTAEDC